MKGSVRSQKLVVLDGSLFPVIVKTAGVILPVEQI